MIYLSSTIVAPLPTSIQEKKDDVMTALCKVPFVLQNSLEVVLVGVIVELEGSLQNNFVVPSTVCGIAIEAEDNFATQIPPEGRRDYSI